MYAPNTQRGVFSGPHDSACKMLNFQLPPLGYLIIEEFVGFTLKFAYFSPKQKDLSSIKDYLWHNPKFSKEN